MRQPWSVGGLRIQQVRRLIEAGRVSMRRYDVAGDEDGDGRPALDACKQLAPMKE
jgi:hypothetical protein